LRAAVEHARPFLGFRVERVLQAADLRTPEHRARAADAALGVIAEHPDAAVRDQYALEVAARCKLDAATLRARAAGGAARPIAPARTRDRLPAEEHPSPELEALKLAVHQRDSVDGRLHEVLFAEPLYAAAWRSLAASASIHEAIAGAHPDVGVLLGRLAVEECEDDPDDVVARLVHEAARRSLRELETEAAVAVDPLEYAEVVAWLQLTIEQLSDPALVVHASDVLLAWLMDRQHVEAQQAHGAGA
jgi:DNA primase